MKVLIIGSGGREHALAWKIAQSEKVSKVFVAPGNAGTAMEPKVENIPLHGSDIPALADFADKEKVSLTIVGPEDPLVEGLADAFQSAGLKCFGPSAKAARLEGSKSFCKDFLSRHHIPTAAYKNLTEVDAARDYIRELGVPVVIKADGLAAGKGVIVAQNEAEAFSAVEDMLTKRVFGDAGRRIVVEEFLRGEEVSFIVMVDGKNILPLATSQDHKARDDGDRGPNTGGMGAYSPAPVVTAAVHDRIMAKVIEPTVKGMSEDGCPYLGFLYAGLMIDPEGNAKVLEYNCRFGDPETQPILMRLNSDMLELCLAAMEGRLDRIRPEWDPRVALGVVMAAGGYPVQYDKGHVIAGLPEKEAGGVKVFHAGTLIKDGGIVTSGGRVLCVTALGQSVGEARTRAYGQVKSITWKDVYFRTDIGYRAVAREN